MLNSPFLKDRSNRVSPTSWRAISRLAAGTFTAADPDCAAPSCPRDSAGNDPATHAAATKLHENIRLNISFIIPFPRFSSIRKIPIPAKAAHGEKREIAFLLKFGDTLSMRPAFLLLPGMLLTLCACGRGGATLETDNVQAEWFPNGSRTAIVLDGETEPAPAREIQRANSGMTLLYNSLGDGRGTLGINGALPETATVTYRQGTSPAVLHFKTSSREILLSGVCRLDAEGKTSSLTGWSCQERGTALPRTGTAGTMTTENSGQ